MPGSAAILALFDSIRRIHDDDDAQVLISFLSHCDKPTILSFLNAHAVNLCSASGTVLDAFRTADILLRDGIGMKAALKALGRTPGRNMNGTDYIPFLLDALPARRLAVYGTRSPWLERGVERLQAITAHDVIDADHGFHPADHYLAAVRRHRPDIVLLAMGMPTQEAVAARLKREADWPVLIINGGAIVDFLAGRVGRAPLILRRSGLEWTFRLAQEPKRLFRRYCIGGLAFARTVMQLRLTVNDGAIHAYEEL